ncbi:TIR domain-containing protein [Nocardia brasiliensis]|uniref:TIR domain-containing protein n=1 Tax=Nocardia brasiliensis TaxID=37326 RepID=UPI003D8D2DDA
MPKMPKSVFYSFHYNKDHWRVQTVQKIGKIEGKPVLNAQDWETVRRQSKDAIERWIDQQMRYKSAVVVLVGAETSTRPWVDYEIRKAWDDRRPLVGVRIHGLKDQYEKQDPPGANPFVSVKLTNGRFLSEFVRLHDPVGITSQQVYASISENIESWVDSAVVRS